MNTQANNTSLQTAQQATNQQSFAAAEYICTVVDGVVVYEESDALILDFGFDSY